jgi:hypothetical protein
MYLLTAAFARGKELVEIGWNNDEFIQDRK